LRTVAGLKLPIRCYLTAGNYSGSCVKSDFCEVLKSPNFSADNCAPFLADNSMDCTCPFNIPARRIDIKTAFVLADLSMTTISWMASGDFDLDIKLTQGTTSIIYLSRKYSVKPKLHNRKCCIFEFYKNNKTALFLNLKKLFFYILFKNKLE
jgi:hypothetical protein